MGCVYSCRTGKGGLLVPIERQTRRYIIRKLNHISQKAVASQLRRLMCANANGLLHTWCPKTTTDFSRYTNAEIQRLEANVNAISRPISLKGDTANEAFQRLTRQHPV